MDYEEKYKEALEKLQKALAPTEHGSKIYGLTRGCIENIFPELKESEGEKIRKDLIEWIEEFPDTIWRGHYKKDVLAWLEKQGEQPTDKVEPKFKAGNWYQCTKDFFGKGVTFDKNTAYYCAKEGCLQNEYGCHIAIVKDLYDNFKLWSIEDARDGDVLSYETGNELRIFIYKNGHIHYHCCYSNGHLTTIDSFFVVPKYLLCYIHPATKEQRDTLIKAMANAGYTFDFEKKEFKEIESKKLDPDKVIEWLNDQACQGWIEDVEVDKFVAKFKQDFGL